MDENDFYVSFRKRLGKIVDREKAKEHYFKEFTAAQAKLEEAYKKFRYAIGRIENVNGCIDGCLGYIEEKDFEAARTLWNLVSESLGDGEAVKEMKDAIQKFYIYSEDGLNAKERIYRASHDDPKAFESEFTKDKIQMRMLKVEIEDRSGKVYRKIEHHEQNEDITRHWREA